MNGVEILNAFGQPILRATDRTTRLILSFTATLPESTNSVTYSQPVLADGNHFAYGDKVKAICGNGTIIVYRATSSTQAISTEVFCFSG